MDDDNNRNAVKAFHNDIIDHQSEEIPCNSASKPPVAVYRIKPFDITKTDYGQFCQVNKPSYTSENDKVIMLVGESGAGKSTLINRMANYLFGVEYNDPYQFEVIADNPLKKQIESQTSVVTVYQFCINPTLPFNISIIDTPGFGSTKKVDSQTVHEIKKFYDTALFREVHAIGFVAKYGNIRLTNFQCCIIESVTKLFPKEVEKIFHIMATHCDDTDPDEIPVKEALQAQKFPNDYVYLYNNQLKKKGQVQQLFWELSDVSCKNFIDKVESTSRSLSLDKSKDLLEKKDDVMVKVKHLTMKLEEGINRMDQLSMDKLGIESNKVKIENNKSYTYRTVILGERLEKVSNNYICSTRCKQCKTVCHYPCSKRLSIRWCSAITWFQKDGERRCKVCGLGKCSWKDHEQFDKYYVPFSKLAYKKHEDMNRDYNVPSTETDRYKKITKAWEEKIIKAFTELLNSFKELHDCCDYINKFALQCTSTAPLIFERHIETLIESEKENKADGHEIRIKCLESLLILEKKNSYKNYSSADDKEKLEYIKQFCTNWTTL